MSKTNQPHPHAELMLQYAQDAMETDNPVERWEMYSTSYAKWISCQEEHPAWCKEIKYRRKPKTVVINGREVVAPMSIKPSNNQKFYVACPLELNWSIEQTWDNECYHSQNWFERGLCFETKEDAVAYAKAMVNYQEVEDTNYLY